MRPDLADRLHMPVLVPIFPRPDDYELDGYQTSQYLGVGIVKTRVAEYARQDLQLIAMIDDARERLGTIGITMGERVYMIGHSASGMYTSRFALLHPERIQAAAFCSMGWPAAPVARWKGKSLPYPYGIADCKRLFSRDFDLEEFRRVPLFICIGSEDDNSFALPYRTFYDNYQSLMDTWLRESTGYDPTALLRESELLFNSIGANAQFRVYEGEGHMLPDHVYSDIEDFIRSH